MLQIAESTTYTEKYNGQTFSYTFMFYVSHNKWSYFWIMQERNLTAFK